MATRRYEHLIKPLSAGKVKDEKIKIGPVTLENGPGNAAQKVCLTGQEHMEGLNLSFTWGLHNGLGDWHSGRQLHSHPYPECHVFVGLDTANANYLGAEIEFCLGEEQEIYSFDEPTAVVVPAGVPHGPVTTKRIVSPKGFGCYVAALSSIPKSKWVEKSSQATQPTGKYQHLVKSLKPHIAIERGEINLAGFTPEQMARLMKENKNGQMKAGPGNADHLIRIFGSDLENLDVKMDWGFFSHTGIWSRGAGAQIHSADEVLVYVGTDPTNIDFLGAEIEIDLGKEHERYLINKPAVVICPAGTPHTPIVTHWVDRPYAFFSINLAAQPEISFID